MTDEQLHEMMRELDCCASDPPEYADQILMTKSPDSGRWLVTAEHGTKVNRYVVAEEVRVTPVSDSDFEAQEKGE